jgi:hypothetical protein
MRRLLSILLLAAIALSLVAPVLAFSQDPDAGLPACCRRHGQHHCTMLDAGSDGSVHRVSAICPAWPQRGVPSPVGSHHFAECTSLVSVSLRSDPSVPLQTHTGRPAVRERLHPKRGPPTRLLA